MSFLTTRDFLAATFRQDADFSHTTFARQARFGFSRFAGAARFLQTKFTPDATEEDRDPCAEFTYATFEKPELVKFYNTSLRHALFHTCDVSKFEFSDVKWRLRKNGKSMVLDEDVPVLDAEPLRPRKGDPNERNYRLVAELYHQLKKNYDDRCDYWTAGDFHYSEMEMKRLNIARAGCIGRCLGRLHFSARRVRHYIARVVLATGLGKSQARKVAKLVPPIIGVTEARVNGSRRWLHQKLGLVACYKYASAYGESYVRPAVLLTSVLLIFALLYPATGLNVDPGISTPVGVPSSAAPTSPAVAPLGAERLTYWRPWKANQGPTAVWSARARLFGYGFMTSLYVAALQRDLTYQPSYPWGRLLALIELLLTSTLAALFLLAVRRQFKR
jgi:hypothetical protein